MDVTYVKYAARLITSIKKAGWEGKITILTRDKTLNWNEDIYHIGEMKFHTKKFSDDRWLMLDIITPFKDGDVVMWIDSDAIVKPGFDKLFEYGNGGISAVPVNHYYQREHNSYQRVFSQRPQKWYSDGTIVFTVNDKSREFFRTWLIACGMSDRYRHGTMFAFNMALEMSGMAVDIPRDTHLFTHDILNKRENENALIVQYGGNNGKDVWLKEYKECL